MHRVAEISAIAHAMREVGGELLHLAHGVRLRTLLQHLVVCAHDLVALRFRRVIVRTRFHVLLDLPEDPRIRRRCPPDHHRIAASLSNHSASVFRCANIAIPDHRDLHRLLDRRNPIPARLPAVTLLAPAMTFATAPLLPW